MYPDVGRPGARERRIGFALIGVLVAAALLVFLADEVQRALVEGPRLVVLAQEASGLEAGADVWVAGAPAGRIISIGFRAPDTLGAPRVLIRAVLHRDVGSVLRADAYGTVRHSALLAPVVLSIQPGDPDQPPFNYRDTLRARVPVSLETIEIRADTARTLIERLRPLSDSLAVRLARGPGTLAALRDNPALARALRRNLDRLRTLRERSLAEGSLGRLAADTALWATLKSVRERLDTLRGSPSVSRAVAGRDGELLLALDGLSNRAALLEQRLAGAQGSAGRILYDEELLDQVRLLRARIDSTRTELIAEPLRWLRIRLF